MSRIQRHIRKMEEYKHSERLLKSRIDDLTFENTKLQKPQNEELANDPKENQTKLGEYCDESEALAASKMDHQNKFQAQFHGQG